MVLVLNLKHLERNLGMVLYFFYHVWFPRYNFPAAVCTGWPIRSATIFCWLWFGSSPCHANSNRFVQGGWGGCPPLSLQKMSKKNYFIFGPSQERVKLRPGQLPRHGVHQCQGVCCDHAGTQKPQIRAFGRNRLKFGPLESFSRSGLLTKFQLIPIMILSDTFKLLLHLSHTSLLIVSWCRRAWNTGLSTFFDWPLSDAIDDDIRTANTQTG